MPSKTAADSPQYTWIERLKFATASNLVAFILRIIGLTLRVDCSFEPGSLPSGLADLPGVILVFWHRCVFPATLFFRERGIGVMTSQSVDGEYIARVISKFGYVPVRGSSSRGGARALIAMRKMLEQNGIVAFTIDGPRGPIYVAKPGPVVLAASTGAPIVPFYVGVEKAWVMNSWDRFMVPKPFSRVHLVIGEMIRVPARLSETGVEEHRGRMQAGLERVTRAAEQKLGIPPLQVPLVGTSNGE